MWQSIIQGFQAVLTFFYDATVNLGIPSYALAIFLFTLIVKLILYPLTYKQVVSTRKMQEIQPEVKAIQEKYKNNPEKANQAVMELYQARGVSMLGGCLPLLVQMPIIIALYQALRSFQYSDIGASFFWVPHLRESDPYYIIPILVAVSTFLQTKLTTPRTSNDATANSTNTAMLYFMPLMIGFISRTLPTGLGLYWIFQSLFSVLQQLIINRKIGIPKGEVGKNEKSRDLGKNSR